MKTSSALGHSSLGGVHIATLENSNAGRGLSNRTKAKAEMGAWLADYFDDAGYEQWAMFPEMFKAMMINSFPPIDALDAKAAIEEGSLSEFEAKQLRFMSADEFRILVATAAVEEGLDEMLSYTEVKSLNFAMGQAERAKNS